MVKRQRGNSALDRGPRIGAVGQEAPLVVYGARKSWRHLNRQIIT
ncbi:hypothetical protein ABT030_51950 [Streptomyces mirabilis]